MNRTLRIASRGSELALWQANAVRDALTAAAPALRVEIEVVRTLGDRVLDVPLARIGDRGLFTKEIDAALLDGRADLAVHSLKDVPTRLPDGLRLVAVTEREDPRDVLLVRSGLPTTLSELPAGARVGSSSLRRRAQLLRLRPDLQLLDLRGNLNTRLARLDRGDYEAILLAAAGVRRLGWESRISQLLEPEGWLPAVGQGALALVVRDDREDLTEPLRSVHHPATASAVAAERAFLHALQGGCQVPIGALGRLQDGALRLDGLVSDLDGAECLRAQRSAPAEHADDLGRALADDLRSRGAERILARVREAGGAEPPPAP